MKPINILVGIPNQGTIKTQTVRSLMSLFQDSQGHNINFGIFMPQHTLFIQSRNEVIENLKDKLINYHYIMWIDSDMVFTFKDIKKLIDADKDVICAPVRVRNKNDLYNVGDNDGTLMTKLERTTLKDEIFEISYTGMAFMLCKTEVFKDFKTFKITEDMSEGGHFCNYIRSIGKKIYCHRDVNVGHIFEEINY
jgi:hypothetical protein